MAGRRTNQALLVAVTGSLLTGPTMYLVGTGWNRWLTLAHGTCGITAVLLAPWKSVVVRQGTRRRGLAGAVPSFVLLAAATVALATGFAHRADIRDLGPVLAQQVHVGAAIVVAVALVQHLRTRPRQLRRTDLDRRAVLRGGLLGGGALATTIVAPHASERFTRSLERGSGDPSAMPVVQWFDDSVPDVDPIAWRLRIGPRSWDLEQLVAMRDAEVVATLDCTGGWYAEQSWSGVRLDRLLAASDTTEGRSVRVASVTGYWRRFPLADARNLLVATAVGGAPLSRGHGFPARVVAPGRRGFWWVKWVSRIDVDDTPWWWQPPVPLT